MSILRDLSKAKKIVKDKYEARRLLAEEEIRESERKYRELADSITDVFFAMDKDLRYTYWNKASEKLVGISAKDAIGKSIFELFPDNEETRRAVRIYQAVLKLGHPQTFVNEYHLRGKKSFFEISAYPSKDGLSVFAKDITERKRMEENLRESEEKFRNLAEQSPNMIFINKKGRVVYANERCEEVMGYKREDFYSPDFNFFTLVAPEFTETVKAAFNRHTRNKEVVPYEYALITKEGKIIEAILTTKLIQYEGDRAILGIVTDISERKRAEEVLKESEEKFRSVIENASIPIFFTDFKGNVLACNKRVAELTGYPMGVLVRKNFLKIGILPKKYRFKTAKLLLEAKARLNKKPFLAIDILRGSEIFEFTRKDGKKVTIEIMAMGIKGKHGVEIMCIIRDITRYKKLEKELGQTMRELKKLKAKLKSS